MAGRRIAMMIGAAAVVLTAGASSAQAATPAARPHRMSLVWTTITTNVGGSLQIQKDAYRSVGAPFGMSTVRTEAPRGNRYRARVDFTGTNARGTWSGLIDVTKTYVLSTKTRQVIDYRGSGYLDGGTGAWANLSVFRATLSRLTFRGRADCTAEGCKARFTVTGTAWY